MPGPAKGSLDVIRRIRVGALALVTCCALAGGAAATSIQVTTVPGMQSDKLRASGTFTLLAYTQQFRSSNPVIDPAGPNATQTVTSVLGGKPGTATPKEGPSIAVVLTDSIGPNQTQAFYGDKAKMRPGSETFGPTASTGLRRKQDLTANGDNVTVTSTSGIYTAQAAASVSNTGARTISVSTSRNDRIPAPPANGRAAAQANDPFFVPSGLALAYDPIVTGTMLLDSPQLLGGFSAFAVDSSVFTSDSLDNFPNDGSPIDQTLWYLSVGGRDDRGGPTALIDFQINPLALREIQFDSSFLASLDPYTDGPSEAMSINKGIDSLIASQVSFDDSAFNFDRVHVFPQNTVFRAMGSGVDYADALDAAVFAVPEPASWVMVVAGVLGLLCSCTWVGRRAQPGRAEARPVLRIM